MPNTRDTLYRKGVKRVTASAATEGQAMDHDLEGQARNDAEAMARFNADGYSHDVYQAEAVEEEGPAEQVIKRMPGKWQIRFRKLARLIDKALLLGSRLVFTFWELRPWREKTPQEIADEEEMKARRKMSRIYRKEAGVFARRAANAYHRMGLSYQPPMYRRSLFGGGIRYVKFSHIVAERNAIWMKIDTQRLPYGVNILDLVDNDIVLTNLSASLRHHVQGRYDVERGAWLIVERGRGARGIPQLVTYEKMMELMQANAHGLTIPLGETVNSKRIYRNLRDFPHLLIGGATGRGKTSYLNVILAALIERNTPDDLRIVLVDLKGGIEFEIYRGIPHLWKIGGSREADGSRKKDEELIAPDGIVGRTDRVIKLLRRLKVEGENRLNYFRRAGVSNIDEYNARRTKSRMDRIVVVFDEWARVSLSEDGREADSLLADITATYRAVGFHVILATQTPTTRVVSTLIKTNFNARLAFGVPDNTASMVILDNIKAKNLSPVGRSIFKFGIMEIETQVPFIGKGELLKIIAEAREDGGAVESGVSLLEILRYSLQQLDGSLAIQRLYEQFREEIGHHALQDKLRAMDEMLIDIDGVEYIVKPPNGGNIPRRLEAYKKDDAPPTPTQEMESV